MKFEEFPIGAPTNVRRSEYTVPLTDPSEIRFKGFIACRVGAPKDLKVPLLGLKTGGKLFFALCLGTSSLLRKISKFQVSECVKTNNQLRCTHSEKERSFNGVFTTAELKKALELGYVIIEIHHVGDPCKNLSINFCFQAIKYDNWATNDADGAGGLFTSYINEMMAGKIVSLKFFYTFHTPIFSVCIRMARRCDDTRRAGRLHCLLHGPRYRRQRQKQVQSIPTTPSRNEVVGELIGKLFHLKS